MAFCGVEHGLRGALRGVGVTLVGGLELQGAAAVGRIAQDLAHRMAPTAFALCSLRSDTPVPDHLTRALFSMWSSELPAPTTGTP